MISDFGNNTVLHPLVKYTDLLSKNDRGPDATRRCNLYDDTSAVEKVTNWIEGREYTVAVTESAVPFKAANATMRVAPAGAHFSDVAIEMDYVIKFGPVGWLVGALIIRPAMKKVFAQISNGLAHYTATGELIGEHGVPQKSGQDEVESDAGLRISS